MRNHIKLGLFPLAVASLLAACGDGKASLGGATSLDAGSGDATAAGAKCEMPKSWSNDSEEGVIIATEAEKTIDSAAVDDSHAYYVVSTNDGETSEVRRVSLDGGVPETLAELGRTSEGVLALRTDSVLVLEFEGNTNSAALVSVPKTGGAHTTLVEGLAMRKVVVDADGEVYVDLHSEGSDILVARVNADRSTTPVVRAPEEVAPYGVSKFAVAGKKVAWVPAQAVSAGESNLIGDALVYVTDVSEATSRRKMFGPYSRTSIYGLAIDERNVYFGTDQGLSVADVKTPNSAKPFGPAGIPGPYAIMLDAEMVYWHTLTPNNRAPREGGNAIGRAPKTSRRRTTFRGTPLGSSLGSERAPPRSGV